MAWSMCLLLVITLTSGVNGESYLAINDEEPHQVCSANRPR